MYRSITADADQQPVVNIGIMMSTGVYIDIYT